MNRLNLQDELEEILGTRNVYFQPPTNLSMQYPCIRYKLSANKAEHADNKIYLKTNCYEITHINKNPESSIPDSILEHFSMCRLDRTYESDNLHHWVFTLYY